MSLKGGVLSRSRGGVFPPVYFVTENACWNESGWCLTLKNMVSACGGFKENDGSLFKNEKMFYPEGLNKVCLFELTGKKKKGT